MDAFILHYILDNLDFCEVWKLRELSTWCKDEIEKESKRYTDKIVIEIVSSEDTFTMFPQEKLTFKCVAFSSKLNLFKFEFVGFSRKGQMYAYNKSTNSTIKTLSDNNNNARSDNTPNNTTPNNNPNAASSTSNNAPYANTASTDKDNENKFSLPKFLKYWEKYCRCSIGFFCEQ